MCKPVTLLSDEVKAIQIAGENNRTDEDGWTYEVEARGAYYAIAVYDEDHELVGYL